MRTPYSYQPLSRPREDDSEAWSRVAEYMRRMREEEKEEYAGDSTGRIKSDDN